MLCVVLFIVAVIVVVVVNRQGKMAQDETWQILN